MPHPADLFSTQYQKAIREEFKLRRPETAISRLAIFIESGLENWENDLKLTGFNLKSEVTRCLSLVKEKELLHNRIVPEPLLLALIRDIRKAEDNWEDAQKLFSERLRGIFPEKLANHLYQRGIDTLHAEQTRMKNGDDLWTSPENIKRHYADIRIAVTALQTSEQKEIWLPGTKTEIIPCPKCQTEKRVGPETKHFRCKNPDCYFDRPYPFGT